MYEIRQRKTELRMRFLEKRAALSAEERGKRDAEICRHLMATATYRFSDVILLYYPVREEIDLRSVMEAALAAGKKVAFPRSDKETREMTFYFVSSEEDFARGAFGIPEPKATLPIFDPAMSRDLHVICAVPGVVYDAHGYRIGYGGGFYDRFLGSCSATTLGIAYSDFIISDVPHGRFDLSVDVMVSERGVYAKK